MINNKNIAIIAHDRRKADLIKWTKFNLKTLSLNNLFCTGTTGTLIKNLFIDIDNVTSMNSGPLGGDAEIASMVVNGNIDLCIFLIDDLFPNPHEADIQMLLRQCRIHNVPVACNLSSADMILSSPIWDDYNYNPIKPSYVDFKR